MSESTGSRFVDIAEQELIDFLEDRGMIEDQPWGKERCFAREGMIGKMHIKLMFLSTLPVGKTAVRPIGTDAFRFFIQGFDNAKGKHTISRTRRFYRTTRWRSTISKALDEWSEMVKYRCTDCHSPLVFQRTDAKKMFCIKCWEDVNTRYANIAHSE